MSNTPSVNDLLNGSSGPPAFKFEAIGDTAKGRITKLDTSQVRDFKTGQPRTYDDGNPIMQIVISLQNDAEDETRVFCKPAARDAIRQACGAHGLEVGGTLALQYCDDEPPEQPGLSPRKLFSAQYQPQRNTMSANDLL